MPRFVVLVVAGILAAASAGAQDPGGVLPLGHESVAYGDGADGLFLNPALAGTRYSSELFLGLLSRDEQFGSSPVHVFGGVPGTAGAPVEGTAFFGAFNLQGLGFTLDAEDDGVSSWSLSLAGGPEPLRWGTAYRWLRDPVNGGHVDDWNFGVLSRPVPWLSLGGVMDHAAEPYLVETKLERAYTLGAGLRPLALWRARAHTWGTQLSVTADYQWQESDIEGGLVRWGGELDLGPGLVLRASLHRDGGQFGIGLRMPRSGANYSLTNPEGPGNPSHVYSFSVHDAEDRSGLGLRAGQRVATTRVSGRLADESLAGFTFFGGGVATRAAAPLHRTLERALEDPLTRGVLLDVRGISGMAQVEELRPRIAALRAAGKPVVAYLEYGANRAGLYLATACDRVVASEEAMFMALGLRVERRYYRKLLEDWGVRVDRAAYGRYKSAFRNFSADSTPPADREAIERNLDVAQELFVSAVCADRRITRETLLPLLEGDDVTSQQLVETGVIDSVSMRSDALRVLGRLCNLGSKPSTVRLSRRPEARAEWTIPTRLAVIYASGAIQTGRSGNDFLLGPSMGNETLVEQIEDALDDFSVKAVVLRVESPGGSSLASTLIHGAVERGKREHKKPVIVSMGDAAASGGYHISCNADRIFADRFTRTGSIGVLTVKPSVGGWYQKHDVRQDEFERGRWMGAWSGGRAWTAGEQALADSAILRYYARFVQKVAEGRKMTWGAVDSVAQGRVWMGEDALARGLVDEIGGLEQAVAEARRRAGIPSGEKIRTRELRRPMPGFFQRALADWAADAIGRFSRLPEPGAPLYWDDELHWDDVGVPE
jgi:protease-4